MLRWATGSTLTPTSSNSSPTCASAWASACHRPRFVTYVRRRRRRWTASPTVFEAEGMGDMSYTDLRHQVREVVARHMSGWAGEGVAER